MGVLAQRQYFNEDVNLLVRCVDFSGDFSADFSGYFSADLNGVNSNLGTSPRVFLEHCVDK